MTIQDSLDNLTGSTGNYFTELRDLLEELINALTVMGDHKANGDNPHQTTKDDLGLGNLLNFPLASVPESRNQMFNYGYMTPFLTHYAITDRLQEVDKDHVGLGSVQNYAVASSGQARAGTSNTQYMTPLRVQENFNENTKHVKGRKGDLLFVSENNKAMALETDLLLKRNPALVQGTTEMDQLKGLVESFELVFDEWYRISHNGPTQPADATELTGWSYDAATDSINSTINSSTLIGLISPERHTDFVFDVVVKSTNNDDDLIGVCFGFVTDGGQECTLTAMRTPGGAITGGTSGKLFNLRYNHGQADAMDLGSTNGGLMWGDGIVDDGRVIASDINTVDPEAGWGFWPDGCRIRVERFGDVFTLQTSDLGQTTLKPSATVVIDINDYPELEKFRGPIQFGYVCLSQADSTWDVWRRPVELGTIVDADTLEAWQWDGEQFVVIPESDAKSQILPNRLYYTEMTGKLYYNEPFKGLIKISG